MHLDVLATNNSLGTFRSLHFTAEGPLTDARGPIRRGKLGDLAWKQSGMWESGNEFPKTKRRKYPQYTSELHIIMCNYVHIEPVIHSSERL